MLSFGVPVRNAERFLPRLLDSLARQNFSDFEVVICDNASNDRTADIVLSYAERDPRFRYVANPTNIGQVENFNRVLLLARGKYFRWIGYDDWLEPSYARRCIEVLEREPDKIGVTTYQDHVEDDGTRHYAEYTGPRLDSPHPEVRFRQMCWFLTADYRFIDPIYSMMRREALLQTRRLLMVPQMDQVLAAELALLGPFAHLPECLAHRRKEHPKDTEVLPRYHPQRHAELDNALIVTRTIPAMWEALRQAQLRPVQLVACSSALARYAAIRTRRRIEPKMRRVAKRGLYWVVNAGGGQP